jgi:hypothetical protein
LLGPSSSFASHAPSCFFHPSPPLTCLHNVLYLTTFYGHWNCPLAHLLTNRG